MRAAMAPTPPRSTPSCRSSSGAGPSSTGRGRSRPFPMATTASRPVLDERLLAAVGSIRAWGEARDWRGYDPYDGLSSPLAGGLTLGSPVGRRLLTQGVKLSPLNLRPLLGIRPAWNAKALGLVASGYARLAAAADDAGARDQATRWLDWLAEHHAGDGGGHAWGYHFPVETRFFGYPSGAPNTIATSFVAQAFLDGYELLGEPGRLETAASAARFLEPRLLTRDRGRPYFRYLAGHDDLVHNANVLACAVLARTSRLAGEPLPALVDAALAVTLAAQR